MVDFINIHTSAKIVYFINSIAMRHVPKMALVTFENRPNFVGTLLKLWGNDSNHFWAFSEKITFRCQSGVTLVTDVPKLIQMQMFIVIISNYWKSFGTDIC